MAERETSRPTARQCQNWNLGISHPFLFLSVAMTTIRLDWTSPEGQPQPQEGEQAWFQVNQAGDMHWATYTQGYITLHHPATTSPSPLSLRAYFRHGSAAH